MSKEATIQTTADIQADLETKSSDELNKLIEQGDGSETETDAAGADTEPETQTGEKAEGEGDETGQTGEENGKAEDDAKDDEAEGETASEKETTGEPQVEAEKLARRVEEKEKIIGRQGSELGQLRPLKTLVEKFSENPDIAIEYYTKLRKEKYGDKPKDSPDIADEDMEALQTAILSDDKASLKTAFTSIFEKAITKQKSREEVIRATEEARKAEEKALVNETKSFLTSLNQDHDKPEMVSIIKEVMLENGVKAENVETALAKFYLLPREYTAAWVTEAKARHQINAIKAEAEQTKNKAAGLLDKIGKTTRTMKGVNASSGQAVPKAAPKKPSVEDMQTWSKEDLEKFLNEKEE